MFQYNNVIYNELDKNITSFCQKGHVCFLFNVYFEQP